MEAALRTVCDILNGTSSDAIDYVQVRGIEDGIKIAEVEILDLKIRAAVAHGLGNARKLIERVKAGEKFENALAAARSRVIADKLTLAKSIARSLASAWEEVKAGTPLAEGRLAIDHLDRFPKLAAAAALIGQAAAGDDKAKAKLLKSFESAAAEHKRIISELEKLVGIESPGESKPAVDDALALAAELTAAIAGNFAASSAHESRPKSIDPKQLLAEFANAGLLERDALEASFERFDNAYGKIR